MCECANLDWDGHDMTAEHHPECKRYEGVDERYRNVEARQSTAIQFNGTFSYVLIHEPTGSIRHTITIDNPARKLRAYLADEEDPPAYYFRLFDHS